MATADNSTLKEGRFFGFPYNGIFWNRYRVHLLYVDLETTFAVKKDGAIDFPTASLLIRGFGLALWRAHRVGHLLSWAREQAIPVQLQRERDSNIDRRLIRVEDFEGYAADYPPTQVERDLFEKDLERCKGSLRRLTNRRLACHWRYILIDELPDPFPRTDSFAE